MLSAVNATVKPGRACILAAVCMLACVRGGEFQTGEAPRVVAPLVPAGTGSRAGVRSLTVDTTNRAAVAAFYTTNYTTPPAIGWTGSYTSPYDPGTISSTFQDATLFRVNFYRAMAGLPATVVLDPTLNAKCQQAALMMSVAGTLSHSPPSTPNATWPYATADGADAAGHSNLSLGTVGPGAMDGLMADPGSNNTFAGHRRWILYPPQVTMGHGAVPGGTGIYSADALWVVGTFGPRPATPTNIAWPAAGYFPYQLLPFDYQTTPSFAYIPGRWTFSINGADFTAASVTMAQGGTNVAVQQETVTNGYGDNTLVWHATGVPLSAPAADTQYDVTVSNVKVGGSAKTFNYSVIVFDPASAVGTSPVAKAQTLSTLENTPLNITLTGLNASTFTIATPPTQGMLSPLNAATGAVTYTPTTGYTGPDSFTFTVSNGSTVSAPATVSITVGTSGGATYPAELTTYLQANSLPVNATPATSAAPQSKTTLSIHLNFKTNLDGLTFVTPLTLPAGFMLSGRKVVVDVGGVIRAYTLDPTGKDISDKTSTLKATGKLKSGALAAAGAAKFTLKLSKTALETTLAGAGLKDDKVYSKTPLMIPVTIVLIDATASTLMSGTMTVNYTAAPGKTGKAAGSL